jgi:hypothetical protein
MDAMTINLNLIKLKPIQIDFKVGSPLFAQLRDAVPELIAVGRDRGQEAVQHGRGPDQAIRSLARLDRLAREGRCWTHWTKRKQEHAFAL